MNLHLWLIISILQYSFDDFEKGDSDEMKQNSSMRECLIMGNYGKLICANAEGVYFDSRGGEFQCECIFFIYFLFVRVFSYHHCF